MFFVSNVEMSNYRYSNPMVPDYPTKMDAIWDPIKDRTLFHHLNTGLVKYVLGISRRVI